MSDHIKRFLKGLPRNGLDLGAWSRAAVGLCTALSATFSDLLEIETALPEIESHTLPQSLFLAGPSRLLAGRFRFQAGMSRFPAGRKYFCDI